MNMSAMPETFREQRRNLEYQELSFEVHFGLLGDIEGYGRQNSKHHCLIKSVVLCNTHAYIQATLLVEN